MIIRFSLLIYLVIFDILANIGSYIGPEVIMFNKVLRFVLFIVIYNGGIISLFYYPNAETLRDIESFFGKIEYFNPTPSLLYYYLKF